MVNRRSREYIHQKNHHNKRRSPLGCLFKFLIVLIIAGGLYVGYTYYSLRQSFKQINQAELLQRESGPQKEQIRDNNVEIGADPVSILIMGIDTGGERTDTGRSDIMIVATLNPHTNQATITSIPRDSYVEIDGVPNKDKINHAYAFGGANMAANTVQNLLGIPIDYTFSMDMEGFVKAVDALGGLTITPTMTFEQDVDQFVEGQPQQMSGSTVLNYVRNRYTAGGDYGRQERARQVVEALFEKIRNVNNLTNINELINVFGETVATNLTIDDIQDLALDSKDIMNNLQTVNLEGQGETIDGVYYEILDEDQLNHVRETLQNNLEH
ncbi:LCP family protein [Aerococcaceae bacterium DSM 111020]|nr:LCP family protein [Aerococcaceae bacterium DSM 111020]